MTPCAFCFLQRVGEIRIIVIPSRTSLQPIFAPQNYTWNFTSWTIDTNTDSASGTLLLDWSQKWTAWAAPPHVQVWQYWYHPILSTNPHQSHSVLCPSSDTIPLEPTGQETGLVVHHPSSSALACPPQTALQRQSCCSTCSQSVIHWEQVDRGLEGHPRQSTADRHWQLCSGSRKSCRWESGSTTPWNKLCWQSTSVVCGVGCPNHAHSVQQSSCSELPKENLWISGMHQAFVLFLLKGKVQCFCPYIDLGQQ